MSYIDVPAWSTTAFEIMRVGLGLVIVTSITKLQVFRPRGPVSYPVGLARVVDLSWMSNPRVFRRMQFCVYLATLLYVVDVLAAYALLFLSVVFVLEITFQSSHGAVNHGYHLVAVVLIAQTFAIALWNAAGRWDSDAGGLVLGSRDSTAAWWTVQVIVAVYFTSGVVKLVETRGQWISRSSRLLLAARRRSDTERMMGAQRRAAVERSESLAGWLGGRVTMARCVFAAGLLIELATPLGLFGAGPLFVVGLALIGLHASNSLLLTARFPEFQLIVLTFFIVPPLVS